MTPRAAAPLEPCPFCGEVPEIAKHFREAMWQLIHRCKVMGPMKIEWRESIKALTEQWNRRAPSSPLVGELVEALGMAKGYMLNAKIDLETGAKKATALATLEGGLRLIESALARAKERG